MFLMLKKRPQTAANPKGRLIQKSQAQRHKHEASVAKVTVGPKEALACARGAERSPSEMNLIRFFTDVCTPFQQSWKRTGRGGRGPCSSEPWCRPPASMVGMRKTGDSSWIHPKKSADPLPPVPACRGDRRGMQLEVIGISTKSGFPGPVLGLVLGPWFCCFTLLGSPGLIPVPAGVTIPLQTAADTWCPCRIPQASQTAPDWDQPAQGAKSRSLPATGPGQLSPGQFRKNSRTNSK